MPCTGQLGSAPRLSRPYLPHAGRRSLFGCIALLFCRRVLFVDILELI
jgi:hypothetical protein